MSPKVLVACLILQTLSPHQIVPFLSQDFIMIADTVLKANTFETHLTLGNQYVTYQLAPVGDAPVLSHTPRRRYTRTAPDKATARVALSLILA